MWGQECETICTNEEAARKWLAVVVSKGWCYPDTITTMDHVILLENPELNREVDQ